VEETVMLTKDERGSLLKLVRDTIQAKLHGKRLPVFVPESETLKEPRGAFVTLHRHGCLRGCIGYVEAVKPLHKTIQEMAVAAAFEDPRFPSVSPGEYDEIDVEISVLSPLERITDVGKIEVGIHGILIKRGFNSGLLLPQVAGEQNWDRDTFLEHTCYKAGLQGDCWKQPGTQILIFSAEVFSEKEY
jgi:AmmeMemoRadiSam system protein A